MKFQLSAYHYTTLLPDENKIILFSTRSGIGKIISVRLYELLLEGELDFIPTELFLSLCEAELLVDIAEDEQAILYQRLLNSDCLTMPVTVSAQSQYPAVSIHKSEKPYTTLCIHLILDEYAGYDAIHRLVKKIEADYRSGFRFITYIITLTSVGISPDVLRNLLALVQPVEINFNTAEISPEENGYVALLQVIQQYEADFVNPLENRRFLSINRLFPAEPFIPEAIDAIVAAVVQHVPGLTIRNFLAKPAHKALLTHLLNDETYLYLLRKGNLQNFLPRPVPQVKLGTRHDFIPFYGSSDLCDTENTTIGEVRQIMMEQPQYPCCNCYLLPLCGGVWSVKGWTDSYCPAFKENAEEILACAFSVKKTQPVDNN